MYQLIITFKAPENPEAVTIKSLIAVLNTGVDPSGIDCPVKKHDNKHLGPIILGKKAN